MKSSEIAKISNKLFSQIKFSLDPVRLLAAKLLIYALDVRGFS